MAPELSIVQAWQQAANEQDIARLLALSTADIALVGPRGRGTGHALLRQWVARAGLTLTTLRLFHRGDSVVLAQQARWQSAETDGVPSEATIANTLPRPRSAGQRGRAL